MRGEWSDGDNNNGFYYSSRHFVQPTTGLPKDTVNRQWIDLQQLSAKEFLDFSPIFFLSRHKRPAEALVLIEELSTRSENMDFVVAFNHALGVVTETYPMYFTTSVSILRPELGNGVTPLAGILRRARRNIFNHNLYVDLFSTGNKEVIDNLISELSKAGMFRAEFPQILIEAFNLEHFDLEMIKTSVREVRSTMKSSVDLDHGTRLDEGGDYIMYDADTEASQSDEEEYDLDQIDNHNTFLKNAADRHRIVCGIFSDMVVEFQDPEVHYANVTFEIPEDNNDVLSENNHSVPYRD
ncbi:hypothetical protein IWQ62_004113 [Dispira parvispora]|uniref:Uncharacterized protein n=1 Tax=Dispira parvispora TaxID=1520584 RepID=A0A9W8AMK1_9FUNG|nr:hypothetical protein IWQ62_004113 [Dispira parvispora]